MQIAIAESKGCALALSNRPSAPAAWRNQVNNAEFSYSGHKIVPERRVVVATRINPSAKREKTRRLVVRAWNSQENPASMPLGGALDVLALHYYGLCSALGLDGLATMIALSSRRRVGAAADSPPSWEREYREARERSTAQSARDLRPFQIGRQTLRLHLEPLALDAIELLVSLDSGREKEIEGILGVVANTPNRGGTVSEDRYVRSDGVGAVLDRERNQTREAAQQTDED